eukprot:CAMPEP_0168334496 /NCGR_PEP_ID=MMETSP0213-20121227/10304_1 /TAXON_ID=151035 /ORGANISM="Euplotes harpa, Strain FSP1.4" /LENGTH=67 /DNA_ID=CAMNT_0008339155 /DNA_START=398 /DNA_END=601 /DNA_ORIENTATION=+
MYNSSQKSESGFKGYVAESKNKFDAKDMHNRSYVSEYSLQSMGGDDDDYRQNFGYRPPNLNDDNKAF